MLYVFLVKKILNKTLDDPIRLKNTVPLKEDSIINLGRNNYMRYKKKKTSRSQYFWLVITLL